MHRSSLSALLFGIVVFGGLTPAIGKSPCRPAVTINSVRLSEIRSSQRIWFAVVNVDASACAARSGRFEIKFTRLKENAPEVAYSKWFKWRPGEIEVSEDFWADEAVLDYAIGAIAPCTCRD
jgi:hypothetical protein